MTPLSQYRRCMVFWVTFPDGWHMLICFPAAISLFFTVRWSALVIPAVSLQRIPGYQQSNAQRLSSKTQLYPLWKTLPHLTRKRIKQNVRQIDVNASKINRDETKCRFHSILPKLSLNIAYFRVCFWHNSITIRTVERTRSRSVQRTQRKSEITLPF